MSFTGIVEDGKVLLPPEVNLPSGTKVRVEPVEEAIPTLDELLGQVAGKATGLPADMAEQHDHPTDVGCYGSRHVVRSREVRG